MPTDYLLPTLEDWEDIKTNMYQKMGVRTRAGQWLGPSEKWGNLDEAVTRFLKTPTDAAAQDLLQDQIRVYSESTGRFADIVKNLDGNSSLNAFKRILDDDIPELSEAEKAAADEIARERRTAVFRVFKNKEMSINKESFNKAKDTVKQEVREAVNHNLGDVDGVTTLEAREKSREKEFFEEQVFAPAAEAIGLDQSLKEQAKAEAINIIGKETFDLILNFVPVISTIYQGMGVANKLKNVARNELHITGVKSERSSASYVAQDAISGLISILESQRADLAIDLAKSMNEFADTFQVTKVGTGPARIVLCVAKITRVVLQVYSDYGQMARINKFLKGSDMDRADLSLTVAQYPALGAFIIVQMEDSALIDNFNGDLINQPFYMVLVEQQLKKVETIKSVAQDVVKSSRLQLNERPLAPGAGADISPEIRRVLDVVAMKKASGEQERAHLKAHVQDSGLVDKEALFNKAKKSEESRALKRFFETLSQDADAVSIVMARKLYDEYIASTVFDLSEVVAQVKGVNELRGHLSQATGTYKSQTSGYRRFITRQSKASLDAVDAINKKVRNCSDMKDIEHLMSLVKYLLGKDEYQKLSPSQRSKFGYEGNPLKKSSRFRTILETGYQRYESAYRTAAGATKKIELTS